MRQFVKLSLLIDTNRVSSLQRHIRAVQKLITEREGEDKNVEALINLEHFLGVELNNLLSIRELYRKCEQQLYM